MTVNKRKKNSRLRGSHTHGWGAMKKHRGAGSRGGRGMAGTGKRGDAKKPSIWKNDYFGKQGFVSKSRAPEEIIINIKTIEDLTEKLVTEGKIKVQNGAYYINLNELGYNKLLGTGRATKKYMITVDFAAPGAAEKIKKAGGNLTLTGKKRPKKEKKAENAPKPEKKEEKAEAQ